MKVRIKFTKEGPMKFVGHLDTMRYFQKAIRRAELPIAFSGGYSPHMIMSFANPLGIGITSEGEYFDIELKEPSLEQYCRLTYDPELYFNPKAMPIYMKQPVSLPSETTFIKRTRETDSPLQRMAP